MQWEHLDSAAQRRQEWRLVATTRAGTPDRNEQTLYRKHQVDEIRIERGMGVLWSGFVVRGHEYGDLDDAFIPRRSVSIHGIRSVASYFEVHPQLVVLRILRMFFGPIHPRPNDALDEVDACCEFSRFTGCHSRDAALQAEEPAGELRRLLIEHEAAVARQRAEAQRRIAEAKREWVERSRLDPRNLDLPRRNPQSPQSSPRPLTLKEIKARLDAPPGDGGA